MSVPPQRMAPPPQMKDPNKIMGLPKPVFYVLIVVGLILAWYIWKRTQASNAASLQTANAGAQPDTTNGVTAADIGGTPADNSFATVTDEMALQQEIEAMQNSLFQLQQANGGNGAGLPGSNPGGSTGGNGGTNTSLPGQPITFPFPEPSVGPQTIGSSPPQVPVGWQTNPVTFGPNPPSFPVGSLGPGYAEVAPSRTGPMVAA